MNGIEVDAYAFLRGIQPDGASLVVRFPWRGGDDWSARTCYGRLGYGWRALLLWHACRVLRFFTGVT